MPSLLLAGILITALSSSSPGPAPQDLVPFLRVISASVGAAGRVACKDIDLAMQFKKDGLSPDAKSPVAFAGTTAQIKAYLADGKLVVCAEEAGLNAGASIAILREGGKPVLLVNIKNATASGFTLSDALLKIARIQ